MIDYETIKRLKAEGMIVMEGRAHEIFRTKFNVNPEENITLIIIPENRIQK